MSTISEALRELKYLKENLDTSYLDGKTYDDLSNEEIDKWIEDCESSLNKFMGQELEFQITGGGSGPNEWYEDGSGKIVEIYDDDGSLYVKVRTDNDVGSHAFIPYEKFGLSKDSTPKEILDKWESLTLEELNTIAYEPLSENR